MFITGMRAHDIGKMPFGELIAKLKSLNVTNVQFAPGKAVADMDFSYGKFSPGLARFIGNEFSKNGIRVSVFGSYLDPTNPDKEKRAQAVRGYIENLKYAKLIGADMAGTETGKSNRYGTHEEAYAVLLESMRQVVAAAEKLGVMFAVEGVTYETLNSVKTMRRLLDDVNSPNLCVIFDPINLINGEWLDRENEVVDDMFSQCGAELAAIHLKDYKIVNGEREIVPIGQGVFDFERFFAWLKKNKPYINMMIEGSTYENFEKEYEFLKKTYCKV